MYFSTEELDHTVKLAERFFLQNNLFKFKKPNTKSTKTNHYILLTNVSIIHLGGEEFQPDKYLTDFNQCYSSHEY